ncbi:MAG: hypothetical protein JJT89_04435 [Nitriliruptoraceae bacterium]|nr:hypothetical protein [Nitriliruptoraceae bacterium]
MSAADRPWWASESGTGPDETPARRQPTEGVDEAVARHRDARRGARADAPGAEDVVADPPPPDDPRRDDRPPGVGDDRPPVDHAQELCGVCPICVVARTLGETHPDLLEHLGHAARHLRAAVRSLTDPPDTEPGTGGRVERIDLDPS